MSPRSAAACRAWTPKPSTRGVSTWLAARSARSAPAGPRGRLIAVDGKSARGARGPDARPVHLLAALDQASGVVLAQRVVEGKTNEINAFAPLLDRIDITGAVITADALHTQVRHADYLNAPGAHYLLTVRRNQPTLHRQLRTLPWNQVPAVDRTHDKGHGRVESRTVKLTEVSTGIAFPHARLAIQVTRRRRTPTHPRCHTETVYRHDLGRHPRRPDRRRTARTLEHREPAALDTQGHGKVVFHEVSSRLMGRSGSRA